MDGRMGGYIMHILYVHVLLRIPRYLFTNKKYLFVFFVYVCIVLGQYNICPIGTYIYQLCIHSLAFCLFVCLSFLISIVFYIRRKFQLRILDS